MQIERQYRLALYDVDGTIVDSEPRNRKAIETVARIGGYSIQKNDWDFLTGQGDAIIWELLVKEKPELKQVFNTASSFERACLNEKINRIAEVKKLPEVDKSIKYFKEKNLEVAVVSNSVTGDATASLSYAGYQEKDFITSLFRDALRDAGLRAKPHPDPYLEALRRVNEILKQKKQEQGEEFIEITPAECLVLEDSKTGVRAGMAAGMTVIQITDENMPLDKNEAEQIQATHNGLYYPMKRAELMKFCKDILTLPAPI
ncbi:MAG: hypothetical protein CO093_06675 [Alphaproteobacteria bacterium CG_4_9_14_3_um_filter_47_13]|nr:MAG: hypothetical protein CO093_06675 [Alphaproteobacteria bacterium CG_4_9_14_3_um_filter_47_13]